MKPTRWARIHDRGDDLRHHLAAWDRAGFTRLLWAEFTKFRTVRAWVIALCAAAVVFVLLSFLSAFESRAPVPAVPTGPGGEAVSDTYMFVHRTLVGDEPDTDQGTAYAAVMATGSHGVQMQDNYTHGSPGLAGVAGPFSPRWLRLTRAGDVITGYDSTDGARWTEISTARLTGLPRTVQIGLFVTSPVYFPAGAGAPTPSVATATFDQVSVRGDLPRRSWTGDPIAGFYPSVPSAPTWHQRSAGAFTISGSGDIAPLVGDIISAQWAGASIVNGTILALLFVVVIATLPATSEYRRGLIRTTFAASPRRGRVLAANGSYLFPQSGPDLDRVIIGTGLLLGLAAALAVALGTMLRRSAPAVAAGIVLLVLPGILGSQSGNWLMRFTPTAAFAIQATLPRSNLVTSAYTPPNGYFPISPWAGLAVLAAYTAAALGAATWLLRRRDT